MRLIKPFILLPLIIIVTLTLALTAAGASASRGATLRGKVTDAEGEPLPNASVRLLMRSDSSFIRGVAADLDGRYALRDVPPGAYLLQSEYTGFAPAYLPVEVAPGDSLRRMPPIRLGEKSHMLSEVSVVGVKTQIKVKEDTVEFNADSYQTRPNAVVEDLIKRLPGVEVGKDGSITANGKSVTKILLDGKEFFGDDPTVASKNLPVDIVDKVQVVDRKSDLARLTGVDDGEEETVINLTVKKGRNNGWFGQVEGGYGTDDRYKGQFALNRFQNGNQLTLLGNFNNINDAGFADGNGARFRNWGASGGVSETQSVGLNFNVGREEIIRVGGNVLYGHTDRTVRTATERRYLLGDATQTLSSSGAYTDSRSHNIRADFRVLWRPDSFNTLELRPRFTYNKVRTLSLDSTLMRTDGALVSRSFNDDHSRGHSIEAGVNLIYAHNFKQRRGRSFSVNAGYSHSNVTQDALSLALMELLSEEDPDENYDQVEDNHTWTNAVNGRLSWTEPLGRPGTGHFLTVAYRLNYRWNDADKLVDVLDEQTGEYIFSPTLSNSFRNNYFNQDIRLGYKRTTRALNLDAGLSLVPQRSASHDLIDDARSIAPRSTFNVAPYLTLRLRQGKNRSLNVRYNGRTSQPAMSQLQPVADLSDPMNIRVGNPELDPSFRHSLRVRFQDFNPQRQQSVMAMLFANVQQNTVAAVTTMDTETGVRTTGYTNVNGVWDARLMGMYSRPLGASKMWLLTAHAHLAYARDVAFNNGMRNNTGTLTLNVAPSIALRPSTLDVELRPYYRLQNTANSLSTVADMNTHSFGATLNASWFAPFGLVLATDLTFDARRGYSAGYDDDTWLWNASVGWQFLRDRSATVSLKAYDLLGQISSVSRSVTANYIDDVRTNTLTRYFMVTLAWTFNTFGKGNTPQLRDDTPGRFHRHGPPPR